jgi:hypothetical protein
MRAPTAVVLFVGVSYLGGPLFSEAFAAGPVRGGNGGRPLPPRPPGSEIRRGVTEPLKIREKDLSRKLSLGELVERVRIPGNVNTNSRAS